MKTRNVTQRYNFANEVDARCTLCNLLRFFTI